MINEKIILHESDEAARFVTDISGWVSRNGRFYGNNEYLARLDGSTHKKCDLCGNTYTKSSYCKPCHIKKEIARYNAMPQKDWEGGYLYSEYVDKYFESPEDAGEYADDNYMDLSELRLVLCAPQYPSELDPDEIWGELLPEDWTVDGIDPHLCDLVEEVNKYIRQKAVPLSWVPGKFALGIGGGNK